MALQYSVELRNAQLDAIETVAGAFAILKIRSGAPPANCAAADAGTVLASIALPADWMGDAASGSKSKSGTWEDASADDTGTAGHWRLYKSDDTTCVAQGTVTAIGDGGDMTVPNTSFSAGQPFTVDTFTISAGNA